MKPNTKWLAMLQVNRLGKGTCIWPHRLHTHGHESDRKCVYLKEEEGEVGEEGAGDY